MIGARVGLAGAAALASVLAFATPADAGVAPPSITVVGDPAGTVHLLTPGVTSDWSVGMTTRNVSLQQLTATLAASGDVATPADDAMRATIVSMSACTSAWQASGCPGAESLVLAPTTVGAIADAAATVSSQGTIPAQLHLLISVLLPPNTPASVGGKTFVLRLGLAALGVVPEPGTGQTVNPGNSGSAPVPSLPGMLATTGTRITGNALLAVAAIGVGLLIAALARRRRRNAERDDEARA